MLLFPAWLALAEYLLHDLVFASLENREASPIGIIGPSFAVAGMVLMLPVLIPKQRLIQLSPNTQAELAQANLVPFGAYDIVVTIAGWVCLFALTNVWVWTIYLEDHRPLIQWPVPGFEQLIFPATLFVGVCAYGLGALFAELKGSE